MRALVTGGAGFVGRHLVARLLEEKHEVVSVDIDPLVKAPMNKAYKLHMDCRDFFKRDHTAFDLVFHCAAVVGGRLKIEGDPIAVATDLAIDSDFFSWCVRTKPKKVVYFSSSAVYPIGLQSRIIHPTLSETLTTFDTNRIGLPDMTYGFAKLAGEYLAKFAVQNYGLDVVIYRPFSGYGHDQALDYPFPSIIRRVVRKENPIVVWGSGDQERDFIHIDDVVDAVFKTMNVLKPGETLNLGTGIATSFRSLASQACLLLGHDAPIVNDNGRPEGVFSRVADTWKLDNYYKPTRSLEWGILECAEHFRKLDKAKEPVV